MKKVLLGNIRVGIWFGLIFIASSVQASPLIPPHADVYSQATLTAEFSNTLFFPYLSIPITTVTTDASTASISFSSGAVQVGSATSDLSVSTPALPQPVKDMVFSFSSSHKAIAATDSLSSSFTKSFAQSHGFANGVIARDASAGQIPSELQLAWDFQDLSLRAQSKSAFSLLSHTVQLVELVAGQTVPSVTNLGFSFIISDGEIVSASNFSGDTNYFNWFDDNFELYSGEIRFVDQSEPLFANIPLLASPFSNFRVDVSHQQYAANAPPGYTPQVAEKAGFSKSSGVAEPKVYWDQELGILSFDSFATNVLSGFDTGGIMPAYETDALIRGVLEIDPLTFLGEYDSRVYFSGDEVRLVDENGTVLLRANLPAIAFEQNVISDQDFNLFAPIFDIIELQTDGSVWLQDFLQRAAFDSPYLPELFVALDIENLGANPWESSFEVAAEAVLSFTGPNLTVDVPESSILVLLGTAVFVGFRLRFGQKFRVECAAL